MKKIILVLIILASICQKGEFNKHIYILINEQYMKYLYIEGECEYKGGSVKIKNKEVTDLNQLYVDVAFYNYLNYQGNKTSVDELLQEYDNFSNGEGSWDNLEAFYDFEYGDGMPDYEHTCEYKNYDFEVEKYMCDNYDIYIDNATFEQLDEAIEYALEKVYSDND